MGKSLVNQSFRSISKENVRLDKIVVNDICFASFPHHHFAVYNMHIIQVIYLSILPPTIPLLENVGKTLR